MARQSKLEHRVYMRLYRKYRGKNFPREEFDKELALERQREQARLRQKIALEKRQKLVGLQQPKPKEKFPKGFPLYSEPSEPKEHKPRERVFIPIRVDQNSTPIRFWGDEQTKESTLDRERKVGEIVHEKEGASYEGIMKALGSEVKATHHAMDSFRRCPSCGRVMEGSVCLYCIGEKND